MLIFGGVPSFLLSITLANDMGIKFGGLFSKMMNTVDGSEIPSPTTVWMVPPKPL